MSIPAFAPPMVASTLAGRGFPWRLLRRAGNGSTAVVYEAVNEGSGARAALKVIPQELSEIAVREIALLGQIDRRWGPSLLDTGIVDEGRADLPLGARYAAMNWIEGESLHARLESSHPVDRERLAARVAHGVGRGLAELHEAGVRHGDVKPANILLASRESSRDSATDRTVTLVDLGLATYLDGERPRGGTPRYLAPEVVESREAGPPADLYALGVLLAEILEPSLSSFADPTPLTMHSGEPARWAEALLTRAPGARPSASWVARRAARWLELAADPDEEGKAREARVKRAYLAARKRELGVATRIADGVVGRPRLWLEEALGKRMRLAANPGNARDGGEIGAMGPLTRARWIVSLVGPAASSWPLGSEVGLDHELAERMLALARERAPDSWTAGDVAGRVAASVEQPFLTSTMTGDSIARLAHELARAFPGSSAVSIAEEWALEGKAPVAIVLELAAALVRAGESGRAWASLSRYAEGEVEASRAEVARRSGDAPRARAAAEKASSSSSEAARANARATLARLAWDEDRLEDAARHVATDHGPAALEIRALIAYRRGQLDSGAQIVDEALASSPDAEASSRLEAIRGMMEHARGNAETSLTAFSRAVELATRRGAVLDEATYLTGAAAAATDAGDVGSALTTATRAALLWERLGQKGRAARAWLSRAAALSTLGAVHECDEAAEEARLRAEESHDAQATAYSYWPSVEARPAGDRFARESAIRADLALRACSGDDRSRSSARLLVWAPDSIDDARIAETDLAMSDASGPARWEWWGARASAAVKGRGTEASARILSELAALVSVGAPVGSRGPALLAAARLARDSGDGDAARRFDAARGALAARFFERTPAEYRSEAMGLEWTRESRESSLEVSLAPAQVAQLESIVRALATRDRLRPLLDQVVDTMVLWSGVERGLLLLRAPDGRLVARAARNLARHDLRGDQLLLSQGIARRALETGEPVVATDAFASLGDLHASVHALRLRSVLAVPLVARGESLGVVYLDDRARRGAFGPGELAWVRLVASQAAMAIADARDHVLLRRAVRRAERAQKALAELLSEREAELDVTRTELAHAKADGTRYDYDAIVGRSEPMRRLLALLDRVTRSDVPVLIVGESGTGKELVARALHGNGARARRPFVTENCGSIPEALLESALFGHVKGAFTGASSSRAGLFEVADGGTLFLDEIGEMPLSMQAKLLRVLQDGEVRPVGGDRSRHVDVRIVSATHRDLESMVKAGTFREDLLYRLNVMAIQVPSLRERAEDVPQLFSHLLAKHAPGKKLRVTRAAMDKLTGFAWPGNVRQLENEVRRATLLADDRAGRIDVSELSEEIAKSGPAASRDAGLDLRSRIAHLERDAVTTALITTRGNHTQAARLLGLSRFGLQKMMKRLKVERPSPRGSPRSPPRA
jgi:serine/threonine-protein kinase PknK